MAGVLGRALADSTLRHPPGHGQTLEAGYDQAAIAAREVTDGWVPGPLVRGVDEAGVERAWVNFRCAVVLWVTGDGDIDALAERFADRFGMVWRIPGASPATYVVILPATEPLFAEYDALAAALVERLGDAWRAFEPESPVVPLPFAVADQPNLVRHLHGEFVEAANRTKFRSPLDPAPPKRKRPIDLPAPLPELVEAYGLEGAAKQLGKLLRSTIVLELGAEGEAGPGEPRTRVGGRPSLPANLAWPEYAGAPMHFVAQIDLTEVHAVDPEGPLPATGMLWLFVNRDWEASSVVAKRKREGLVQVLHRAEVTELELRASPAPSDPSLGYPATLRAAASLPAPYSPHLAVDRLAGDYHPAARPPRRLGPRQGAQEGRRPAVPDPRRVDRGRRLRPRPLLDRRGRAARGRLGPSPVRDRARLTPTRRARTRTPRRRRSRPRCRGG